MEKVYPTVAEVRDVTLNALRIIEQLTFHDHYVIEDYPIGRRDRGLCKLEAEFVRGKGSRTIRTTTNKYGQWCKPKKSIFTPNIIRVVTGEPVAKEAAWLRVGKEYVSLQNASYDGQVIAKAPHYFKPRREPVTYTVVTKELFSGSERREEQVHEADPPALCDAYDAWEKGLQQIIALVKTMDQVRAQA